MHESERPSLETYLVANREFVKPAVEAAIRGLALAPDAVVLDAGAGGGGATVALATAVPAGRIVAADISVEAMMTATHYIAGEGVAERVEQRLDDIRDIAAEEPGFHAVWASDVIWPGNFDVPAEAVSAMARALRAGGTLAAFTSNYYQATFLPGHPWLLARARQASLLNWDLPDGGPHNHEHLATWFHDAGLIDISVELVPIVAHPVGTDSAARRYLELVVWPEMRSSVCARGDQAGLDADDIATLLRLTSPGDPEYVVDRLGYHLIHPCQLVTGRRP